MYEYGSDTNLIDTVTRECLEEIGLEKKDVQLLGFLNPVKNRSRSLDVTPFIGLVSSNFIPKLNDDEVEELFNYNLSTLIDPNYKRYTLFQNGFRFPVYTGGTYRIWGLSAVITEAFIATTISKYDKKSDQTIFTNYFGPDIKLINK